MAHTETYMTVNPSRGKLCDTDVTTAQYPLHTSQLTSYLLQETIVQSRDRLLQMLQVKMDPDFVPIPVHVIKTRPQYHHPRDNLGRDGDTRCGYSHPPGLGMVASSLTMVRILYLLFAGREITANTLQGGVQEEIGSH